MGLVNRWTALFTLAAGAATAAPAPTEFTDALPLRAQTGRLAGRCFTAN